MMADPNSAANGELKVWQDGTPVLDVDDRPVGFDPSIVPPGATGKPSPTFDVAVGLYRETDVVSADNYDALK